MRVDQKICKSYTFRQYPGKWDIQGVMNFLGDMFENSRQISVPFFITTSVEIPDVVKATAQIQKKAVAAGYQAFGPLARLFPRLGLKRRISISSARWIGRKAGLRLP
jgi:conjugal transfer ATP-binding protein TraC